MTPLFIGLWEDKEGAVETIIAQENLAIYGKSYAEVCLFCNRGRAFQPWTGTQSLRLIVVMVKLH